MENKVSIDFEVNNAKEAQEAIHDISNEAENLVDVLEELALPRIIIKDCDRGTFNITVNNFTGK